MDTMTIDSKLFRCMSRVGDLIVLNLLMLLCSLPVFTAGAAMTAAYDVALRLHRGDELFLARSYLRAFRANWRKATLLWLILLAVALISVGDLLAGNLLPGLRPLLTAAAGIQLLLAACVGLYAFPLQARYENTLSGTLKNALIFALCRLPYTLTMLVIAASPFLALLSIPATSKLFSCAAMLCVFLWFAGAVYANAFLVNRLFQRQFHPEKAAEDDAEVRALREQRMLDGML